MSNETMGQGLDAISARLRTAKAVAWAQLSGLIVCLAAVEAVRAVVRPFFGLAALGGARTAVRYGAFLAAAGVVLAIRAVNGNRLGRREGEADEVWLDRISSASILGSALAELPALLGLALFLMGGYNRDFYALLLVSLVLLFMYFPRASAWQARRAGPGRACPM
jgi:hypothetical protein